MTDKRITWVSPRVGYRVLANGRRSYCFRFRDAEGRVRTEFLGAGSTKKEAETRLAAVTVAKSKGEAVRVSKESFVDYADRWLERARIDLTTGTADLYGWHLEKLIKKSPHLRKQISKIGPEDVAAFVLELKRRGYAGWTIRGAMTVLSNIFNDAVDHRVLASNPVQRVSRRKREKTNDEQPKRVLTGDEVRQLLGAARERGLRWAALVGLMVYGGLRLGEALGLRWQDVDFQGSVLRVRKQRDVKTGELRDLKTKASRREVPISSALGKILADWSFETNFGGPDDPVVSTVTGSSVSQRNAHRTVTELALACGLNTKPEREAVPNVDPHSLRHTAASAWVKAAKGDAEKVARWMGHAGTQVLLQRYSAEFTNVRSDKQIWMDVAAMDAVFQS